GIPNSSFHHEASRAPPAAPSAAPLAAAAAIVPAATAALAPPVKGIASVAPISDPHNPPQPAPWPVVICKLWSTRSLPLVSRYTATASWRSTDQSSFILCS